MKNKKIKKSPPTDIRGPAAHGWEPRGPMADLRELSLPWLWRLHSRTPYFLYPWSLYSPLKKIKKNFPGDYGS